MDFIKKNVFLLACALAGIGSVAGMFWGMSRMSVVRDEMQQVTQLNGQLAGLTKGATNAQAVRYQEQRYEKVLDNYDRVMAHFRNRNDRAPLMPNIFPEPPPGPDAKKLLYEYLAKYREGMEGLLKTLKAVQPPTRQEIENTTDYLKRKAMESSQFGDPTTGGTPVLPGAVTLPAAESALLPKEEGPAGAMAYWQALTERAKIDPLMLTSIDKARSKYCYANLDAGGSFDLHPIFQQQGDLAPGMREIWQAQLLYWMQKDIVDALAAVNNAAARKLDHPWVGNLPVKDVLSIRVSPYIYEDTAGDRRESGDLPLLDPTATWKGRFANKLFDVINIRMRLAVDVRDLPVVLDALCHDRYAMITNLQYEAVKPELTPTTKVYGAEPVVVATVDLQTYLFWKSFVPLMPPVIREELGVEAQYEQLMKELEESAEEAQQPADAQG